MRASFWLLGSTLILTGCITIQAPPAQPYVPPQQPNVPPAVQQQQAPPAASNQPAPPSNLAETAALCEKFEHDRSLPVVCKFFYTDDGSPALLTLFPTPDYASANMDAYVKYLGVPFCEATNQANRHGVLALGVVQSNAARVFNCETESWTDWIPYDFKANKPAERTGERKRVM